MAVAVAEAVAVAVAVLHERLSQVVLTIVFSFSSLPDVSGYFWDPSLLTALMAPSPQTQHAPLRASTSCSCWGRRYWTSV